MDHSAIIDGVDMSQCMFLLLSNTGGKEITKKSFEAWEEGKRREDLRLADFENMILKGAFNEGGGLKKSAIINKSVIGEIKYAIKNKTSLLLKIPVV